MAERRNVFGTLTTAVGEVTGFVALSKPVVSKFNPKGAYTVAILVDKAEGERCLKKIKDIRTEQFKTYGKGSSVVDTKRCMPYFTVDEETGEKIFDKQERYIIKATLDAVNKRDEKNTVQIFNAKGQAVKNVNIGAGSKVALKLDLIGYTAAGNTGVSVRLNAAQLIELVEPTGGRTTTFADSGFTVQEGFDGVGTEFEEETPAKAEESYEEEEPDF